MNELQRAIWLLTITDDYQLTRRGDTWAELIYIHNDPPHPVTRIDIRTEGEAHEHNATQA